MPLPRDDSGETGCPSVGKKRPRPETPVPNVRTAGPSEDPSFVEELFRPAEPPRKRPRFLPQPKLTCGGLVDDVPVPTWASVAEYFDIPESWRETLAPLVENQRFAHTLSAYMRAKNNSVVLPEQKHIFSWTRFCDPEDVKVIIVGQDPYPTEGDAHGLAFSVPQGRRVPPSLRRVFAALRDCYGDQFPEPSSGSLVPWARQGVLLINRHLTVERGLPRSHATMGWDKLTFGVIKALTAANRRMAVMLWGHDAKTFVPAIPKKHLRLEYCHPSTSTRRPFDCRHFVEANEFLEAGGVSGVRWSLA